MINNKVLLNALNTILQVELFADCCPNGLQVEGASKISKIVTGVSLTQALIDKAISCQAQAIIVHHGLFWNKDELAVGSLKKKRLASLLKHNINLYAYHLPLDNHPTLGNNFQLAETLGITISGYTHSQNLLWFGELAQALTPDLFSQLIEGKLQRTPLIFRSSNALPTIKRLAWCTGGACNFFNAAINLEVDAYITGEVNEPIMAMVEESGVSYVAAGHYATERYGMIALTNYIKDSYPVDCEFIELYNPI